MMFPIGPREMICPISENRELRKVAVPDFEDYEAADQTQEN
jgi:exosome complex RNA-binding protein Csl4